ncbi:uncharacterized protein N7496_000592 [Penicillium cataractarum]|uniref:Uncharacterized protein n=1 Tax=Penicillium cataractarum TaxID=2100454 RepID=A0A9X0B626_9EURO|nr:uncharacterized protein N7496_000592 [Penicillium cataractarum]KAJ5389524.1 hypothetical protein N7496_000592 [Penicillium cataractarum]
MVAVEKAKSVSEDDEGHGGRLPVLQNHTTDYETYDYAEERHQVIGGKETDSLTRSFDQVKRVMA